MNRLFKLAFSGLFLALLLMVLRDLDVNKVVFSHTPGPCSIVPGIEKGSEDIVLLTNGVALISSGIYIPAASDNSPGGLYMYDLKALSHRKSPNDTDIPIRPQGLTKLKIQKHPDLETFYPVGIAVWEDPNEPMAPTLYVINSFKHCIEVYTTDLTEGTATFVRSIHDESFRTMNNLVMVGPGQFYVTNALFYTHPILNSLEMLFKLPFGSVVYYDGKKGTEVVSGLQGPSGIALSGGKRHLHVASLLSEQMFTYLIGAEPDSEAPTLTHENSVDGPNGIALSGGRKHLHVASLLSEQIFTYLIGAEPGSEVPTLTHENSVDLLTSPDNLFVDPSDGAVWVGAHPVTFQMITHLFNSAEYAAPSQVLKVNMATSGVAEVYGNDGTNLQGASVAVVFGDQMLIGTVRHKLMVCTLKHH